MFQYIWQFLFPFNSSTVEIYRLHNAQRTFPVFMAIFQAGSCNCYSIRHLQQALIAYLIRYILNYYFFLVLKEHKLQMSECFKNLEISEQAHRQELLKFKEQTLEQSKNCFATYKASMRSLLSRWLRLRAVLSLILLMLTQCIMICQWLK